MSQLRILWSIYNFIKATVIFMTSRPILSHRFLLSDTKQNKVSHNNEATKKKKKKTKTN